MKIKIDLDMFPQGSILYNVIPSLMSIFTNKIEDEQREPDNKLKRRLIGLFEKSFADTMSCASHEYRERGDTLDHLLRVSSAVGIYDNMKTLVSELKEFLKVSVIDIVLVTSYPTKKESIKYEVKQIREFDVFDSIKVEGYMC